MLFNHISKHFEKKNRVYELIVRIDYRIAVLIGTNNLMRVTKFSLLVLNLGISSATSQELKMPVKHGFSSCRFMLDY